MSSREHRRVSRVIDAWIDDELDAAKARVVAAHVRDCWDCSSTAETTRLVKRSLRNRGNREPQHLATARLARFADQLSGT